MLPKHQSLKDIIYNFDPETKEFTCESKAYLDPLETKMAGSNIYTKPAKSTFIKPPKTKKNQVLVFDEEEEKWIIKKDFRGTEYYDVNGDKHIITNIDETVPNDAILEQPTNFITKPKYENGKWIESGLVYNGIEVKTKQDVKDIMRTIITNLGEDKAKTEKLIAGNNKCEVWDEFIKNRAIILKEGNAFIEDNLL